MNELDMLYSQVLQKLASARPMQKTAGDQALNDVYNAVMQKLASLPGMLEDSGLVDAMTNRSAAYSEANPGMWEKIKELLSDATQRGQVFSESGEANDASVRQAMGEQLGRARFGEDVLAAFGAGMQVNPEAAGTAAAGLAGLGAANSMINKQKATSSALQGAQGEAAGLSQALQGAKGESGAANKALKALQGLARNKGGLGKALSYVGM